MIPIRVTVTIDNDILDAVAETAEKAPKLMQTAMRRNVRRVANRLLRSLRKRPPKWRGKRRWKSERQRRAFFATDGFGGGIPYRPTGKLEAGWDVEYTNRDPYSGEFTVVNPVAYAQFVQVDFAQPMHLDSGWPQLAPLVAQVREDIQEVAIQTWFTVSDPYAGVKG
jgi:hypothetical protein